MLLLLIWLTFSTNPDSWTCKEVRLMVKVAGSAERAESIARSTGVSDALIEKARKCIKTNGRPRLN